MSSKSNVKKIVIALVMLMAFAFAWHLFSNNTDEVDVVSSPSQIAQQETVTQTGAPTLVRSNWDVRCSQLEEGEQCEAFKRLTLRDTGQRIAEIAVAPKPAADGEEQTIQFVTVLPLGILVTEPVRLLVDNVERISFPVQYCAGAGCVSRFDGDVGLIQNLRDGETLTLQTLSSEGQPTKIELTLSGFDEAATELGL